MSASSHPSEILLGLHLEKGLSEMVVSTFRSAAGKRLEMKEDWLWNDLHLPGEIERLAEACEAAQIAAGMPLTILINSGPCDDPEDEAARSTVPDSWDYLEFEYQSGTLASRGGTRLVAGALNRCQASPSLVHLLSELLKVDGWFWIDVYIGFFFPYVSDAEALEVSWLWKHALEPWLRWVR